MDGGDEIGLAVTALDRQQAALDENTEHGRVLRHDTDLAVDGLGNHHVGLARPELTLRGDDAYSQLRHFLSSSLSNQVPVRPGRTGTEGD
ncbi:hypothetical protein GCM10010517_48920 [Streptosporangium fragile]|uniref:Uncharacterized protein n=1 Tax=Streptosporangium fragile TaxID=46186 RepID=A0ABN3W4J8_9ACTN